MNQFRKRACRTYKSMSNESFISLIGPPAADGEDESSAKLRAYFENIQYPWSVTSFDPLNRIVCIEITTPSGIRTLSYTLPDLGTSA